MNEAYDNLEFYRTSSLIRRVGKEAVREAIEENKRLGIPSAFELEGKIMYLMPNGDITDKSPW